MDVLANLQLRIVLRALVCTLLLITSIGSLCAQSGSTSVFREADDARIGGRYERAIKLYEEGIAKLDSTVHIEQLAKAHKDCGRVYEALGNYSDAMQNYHLSLQYYKRADDVVGQVDILTAFGYFYELQFDTNSATEYYQKALETARISGNKRALASSMTSLGSLIAHYGPDTEKGHSYLDSAILFSKEDNNLDALSIAYNEKAKAYCVAGDYNRGIELYRKSYQLDVETGNKAGQVISENNIASVFHFIGQQDSALAYATKALENARQLGLLDDQRFSYRIQAYCYKELRMYDLAFESFERYLSLSDSLFFTENMNTVKRLQTEYDSDLKDQEIQSLRQKSLIAAYQQEAIALQSEARKKWIIFIVVCAILILVISASMFLRAQARQRNKMLLKELEATKQKRKVEDELRLSQIKAIKAQMNPHFMFNVLTSVQHFVMNNDTKNALLHLDNFSALMRSILHQSEAHWISLKDELLLLQSYIELEALRFSEGIEYTTVIDLPFDEEGMKLEVDDVMIPSLLIQPLVENAVKHGLSHKSGARKITIEIDSHEESQLHISILDNGVGRAASSKINQRDNSGISLGMNGVEQRLNNVYKATNTTSPEALKIEDLMDDQQQACGTRVSFVIPFVQEDQVHRQKELIV